MNRGVEQELRKAKAGKKKVSHSQHEIRDRKEKQCESRGQETESVIFILNVWK